MLIEHRIFGAGSGRTLATSWPHTCDQQVAAAPKMPNTARYASDWLISPLESKLRRAATRVLFSAFLALCKQFRHTIRQRKWSEYASCITKSYTDFYTRLMPAIDRPRLLQLPTKILGKRCILRPYRSGDGAAMFSAVMEDVDDLMTWMAWPKNHKGADDSENYVRDMAGKWQTRESLTLGIFSLDERTLYGGTGFHGFDWSVPSLEIGWFLRRSARGHGIAAEAVELCCKLAFDHMKVNRVWGSCDALNTRSAKLFERLGFLREGHLRGERRDHRGNVRDTFVYGMLARDWAARTAEVAK